MSDLNGGTRLETLLDGLGEGLISGAHVGESQVLMGLTLVVEDSKVTLSIDVDELVRK